MASLFLQSGCNFADDGGPPAGGLHGELEREPWTVKLSERECRTAALVRFFSLIFRVFGAKKAIPKDFFKNFQFFCCIV